MRKLIPLAAVLLVFVGSRADEKTTAPVPNAPVTSIEGKYVLVATYSGDRGDRGDRGPGFAPGKGAKGDLPDVGAGGPGGLVGGAGGPSGWNPFRRGETTITKNEINIEGRTPTALPTTMEYKLDATKTPTAIDVEITPMRGKKTKSLGIVEVSGNRLTIALGKEGAERPKTTEEVEGVTVYYFMKAPPPPKVEYRIVAMRVGGEAEAEKELNTLTGLGFELVNTTSPLAPNDKASVTTVHFILKRTVR